MSSPYAQFGQVAVKFFEGRRNAKYGIDGKHLHEEEKVQSGIKDTAITHKSPSRGFYAYRGVFGKGWSQQ